MTLHRRHFLAAAAVAGFASALRAAEPVRKYRVGVIGHTGRGDYGHGLNKMWRELPQTEIVAVADANPLGLAASLAMLGVGRGFADYRKLLAETKPDLVAIGMRHVDQHRDAAVAAAESGARGIYIEKPFCRTPAEADEIVAACQAHGVKLAVAHRNRYHPALAAIDRLLEEGAIGELLEIRARGKEDPRGGSLDLWVLGSHVLNLACYFGGRPLACSATLLQEGRLVTASDVVDGAEGVGPLAGNEVHARFDMERGFPTYFDSKQSAGTPAAGFGLQLVGNQGIIDLRIDREPLAHLQEGSPFTPNNKPRTWQPISSAGVGQAEPIENLAADVAGHLMAGRDLIAAIEKDRPPLCSAEDGRQTVEMISAAFESHRQGGARVTLPLESRGNPLASL